MIYLTSWVGWNGQQLINQLGGYLGLSSNARQEIINLFYTLLNGFAGNIIVIAIAPIIYVWRLTQQINITIPTWITDVIYYVANVVRPAWVWAINTLNTVYNFWANRDYYIRLTIDTLLAGWATIFAYVRYLISSGVTWVWDRLPQWIKSALTWLVNAIPNLNSILSLRLEQLRDFIANPFNFIWSILPSRLRTSLQWLHDNIDDIIIIIRTLKSNFVQFINNPPAAILAWIAPYILDFVINKIADDW